MDKQYDIEKISENLNRERKMNSDFNDDDDLGMDFFAHLEEIQKRMNENDENDEQIDKKSQES